MKRTLLAAAAATALALSGCSNGEPAPEPADTSAASQTGPIELKIGETANLTKSINGPRDIDVTVTDINVATECRYGLNDWHDDYTHEGGYFVQVSGDINVKSSPQDFSVPQWAAADEDRNIIEVVPATECADTDEAGVQTFNDLVMPGTKATVEEEYWVDALPSHWFLNEPAEDHAFSWPVPEETEREEPASSTKATAAAEVTTSPAASRSSADAAPTFVNCFLADGTALMSDGTHQYTDYCNESAGGPYLLEDGTSIYENHPNLPASDPLSPNYRPGWHCDGPAYQCRDDAASGKTEGQNWTP